MGFTLIAIERFQIEAELTQIFWLKTANLKLNRHQAIQLTVEKQQIESKVTPTDLQWVFGANKTKIAAQLDKKIF